MDFEKQATGLCVGLQLGAHRTEMGETWFVVNETVRDAIAKALRQSRRDALEGLRGKVETARGSARFDARVHCEPGSIDDALGQVKAYETVLSWIDAELGT